MGARELLELLQGGQPEGLKSPLCSLLVSPEAGMPAREGGLLYSETPSTRPVSRGRDEGRVSWVPKTLRHLIWVKQGLLLLKLLHVQPPLLSAPAGATSAAR